MSVALGGPRVVWAGESGLYGFTLTSQTNVDIPYVEFQYGVPGTPLNEGVPYLGVTTNVTGAPGNRRRTMGERHSDRRRERSIAYDRLCLRSG
ncbi:MAG: hypothetical protein WDN50_13955 [Bradyrhizobium sp.]